MNISKIIKIIIAVIIAIILTAGFLYVKLKQNKPEVGNEAPIISELEKTSVFDREILDSLSIPQSQEAMNNQTGGATENNSKTSDQEILQSLSAKQNKASASKQSDVEVLNSLSASK